MLGSCVTDVVEVEVDSEMEEKEVFAILAVLLLAVEVMERVELVEVVARVGVEIEVKTGAW